MANELLLLTAILWVVGAVLGVPLAGVTRIVFSKLEATKIYADWMAGNIDGIGAAPASAVGS